MQEQHIPFIEDIYSYADVNIATISKSRRKTVSKFIYSTIFEKTNKSMRGCLLKVIET